MNHHIQLFSCWVILYALVIKINFFQKILLEIPPECQTVWIQIRPDRGPNCSQRLSREDISRQSNNICIWRAISKIQLIKLLKHFSFACKFVPIKCHNIPISFNLKSMIKILKGYQGKIWFLHKIPDTKHLKIFSNHLLIYEYCSLWFTTHETYLWYQYMNLCYQDKWTSILLMQSTPFWQYCTLI